MVDRIASLRVCNIVLVVAGMFPPFCLYAQTAAASPAEIGHPGYVVSVVKASAPDSPIRSIHFLPGGRFSATGVNVRLLIKIAYNLNDDQLISGPAWLGVKRFDIDAAPDTPDNGTDSARNHMRLQSLLADRFHLQMRDEIRTMPTYALVIAKGGPKLKKSPVQDLPMQSHGNFGALMLTNATMDQLANAVSDSMGHPVLNHTGLDGEYDLRLDWTPDQLTRPPGLADDVASLPDTGPTIFTALHQQLGLSLEFHKSQGLCKVVDRVELPTEN